MKAIEVRDLKKYYREVKAVDGVTFDVEEGEFFGFLGPNGAGKSTTIRILTTLTRPTSGKAVVAGYDVVKDGKKVRSKIGLVSDKLILYDRLTVLENLLFFGRLYNLEKKTMMERAEELLTMLDLWERRNTQASKLSTGMKQKVNIARALLPRPEILFLDEPTIGLDPITTRKIRDFVKRLNEEGMTIVYTTHLLHEAETLCDRVAIINKGKIVALDTPRNLKRLFTEREVVEFELERPVEINLDCCRVLENVGNYYKVETTDLSRFVEELGKLPVKVRYIKSEEPSLEDIFVKIAGGE